MNVFRRTLLFTLAAFMFFYELAKSNSNEIYEKDNIIITLLGITVFVIAIWESLNDLKIYSSILKYGVAGTGTLISCKTPLIVPGGLNVLLRCFPKVAFYINEERHELEVWGACYKPPGVKGEVLEIIYWDKYPDKVIFRDVYHKKIYTIHLGIWNLFLMALVVGTIVISF